MVEELGERMDTFRNTPNGQAESDSDTLTRMVASLERRVESVESGLGQIEKLAMETIAEQKKVFENFLARLNATEDMTIKTEAIANATRRSNYWSTGSAIVLAVTILTAGIALFNSISTLAIDTYQRIDTLRGAQAERDKELLKEITALRWEWQQHEAEKAARQEAIR